MLVRINADSTLLEVMEARKLMQRIWMIKGCNGVEQEEFYGEAWVAYCESKVAYDKDANCYEYWRYIYSHMLDALEILKQRRNDKMRLESRMSLNMSYVDSHETIEEFLLPIQGDFTNGVVLWDWINHLEKKKREVAILLIQREEDYDIMQILNMDEKEYYQTKRRLKQDFMEYEDGYYN